ncbi:hypothetical protein CASFOL_039074 [Castilleja foliolosa]|uniref:Uncharacterized protein n=1 Tax=Castilleja foliolosa TaxID=1961234 RepID=A0ABD3BGZ9_9LAMI
MSQMELKRSASSPSNLTNPKKRAATPAEDSDSPLAQLYSDVGILTLVKEVKLFPKLVGKGKKFLISLKGLVKSATEESAKIINDEARKVWKFEYSLPLACACTIDKEPSLSDKLIHYSKDAAPAERMDSMMKDEALTFILGDNVLGLKQSDAFIRGFLIILIAYWNMKDILEKTKLGIYGRIRPPAYIPRVNKKHEIIEYEIHHVEDFQNLREVLESKYGSSDPGLAASLFEQRALIQDVGILTLVKEVKLFPKLIGKGKKFLISLKGLVKSSTEESANIVYDEARKLWKFEYSLPLACACTIDKEPSLSDKLIHYSKDAAPAERMDSMMKDEALTFILGDNVLGLKQSDTFIRGFLIILIAYWNMKDILEKTKLAIYGRIRPPAYVPRVDKKHEIIEYEIDHVEDFQNLREVLESKYGSSDPGLAASLFEQISKFQVNGMYLHTMRTWKRAMIKIGLFSEGSNPPHPSKSFVFRALP